MANLKHLKIGEVTYDLGITNLASSSVDGLMSAADKAKLDGIDSGLKDLILKKLDTAEGDFVATYQLGYETTTGEGDSATTTWTQKGASINIPKDQFLKSASIVTIELNKSGEDITKEGVTDTEVASTKEVLRFVFNVEDGTQIADINITDFLQESQYKNGLEVNNNEVSVKIDSSSESFLTVGADGVKLSGIQTAINTAKGEAVSTSKDYVDGLLGTGFAAETGKTVADKLSAIETSLNTDVDTKISGLEDKIGEKAATETITAEQYAALSEDDKKDYTENADGSYTKKTEATGLEKEISDNAAAIAALQEVVNSNKETIDDYTVNGKAISTNPILNASDLAVGKDIKENESDTTNVINSTDSIQSSLENIVKLLASENTRIGSIEDTIGTANTAASTEDSNATGLYKLIEKNASDIASIQAASTPLVAGTTNNEVTVSVVTDEATGAKSYKISGTDKLETAVTKVGTDNYTSTNYVSTDDSLITAVGKLDAQVKANTDAIDEIGYSISDETLTLYLKEMEEKTDTTNIVE